MPLGIERKNDVGGYVCRMNDKIGNSISIHQQTINELEELKEKIYKNQADKIRFRIETKHWYGFDIPHLMKKKSIIDLSEYTMKIVLEEAINKEKERINKLIDMEVSKRKSVEGGVNGFSITNKKEMA